jgi:hypothetical protein
MPILEIGGKQVEVGDEFLQLSPQEQEATVLDIYQQMQAGPPKEDVRTVGPKVMEPAKPEPAPQQPGIVGRALDKWGTQLRGVQAGFFGEYDDEITAGAMAPFQAGYDALTGRGFDIKRAYNERQQSLDAAKQAAMQRNPLDAFVGRVGGGIAQSVAGGKAVEAVGKSVPAVAKGARAWSAFLNKRPVIGGATVGAVQGAISGSGNAKPGERWAGAKKGAMWGAPAGAAAGLVGNLVGRGMGKVPEDHAGILERSSALYQQADGMNIRVREQPLQALAAKVRADNASKLKITKATDKSAAALEYIDELTSQGPIRLRDVEDIRQFIGGLKEQAYRTGDMVNGRILKSIRENFDDTVNNMPQSAVIGADKSTAWNMYGQARQLWHMGRKQEVIDDIFNDAETYRTGFENGLVLKFGALIRNKKKFARFTKQEQDAIRNAAETRDIASLARTLAWLDPRKTLGALLATMVGSQAGPIAGGASAMIGAAATPVANAVRRGRATDVSRVIQGIPLPSAPQYIRAAPGVAGNVTGSWSGRSR